MACTSDPGAWRGVWHDAHSEPQELGKVLIRRIASAKGDLDKIVAQYIDGCPEGWMALDKGERCPEPLGTFAGTFDGIVATCDRAANPLVRDADYLYLLWLAKRRLLVFELDDRPLRPFGMVTFDATGKAKPSKLPSIVHDD